ncbi:MAG: hypothetical protein OCC46_15450 [Pseudodesulfovibrio sp.]
MKKVVVLIAVSLLFVVAGCKTGIQVQDNMYDALGGQVIKVSNDFTYVGQCDPDFMSYSGQGRAKVNNGVKTRGDVFVKAVDGEPAEIFIVQRAMLIKTGHYWKATNGDPTDFFGKKFDESYFDANKHDQVTVQSYMNFLNQNGYSIKEPDLYVRVLQRTIGKQTLAFMFYGVYPGIIPESQRGNVDMEKQFIRERFDANISTVQ